MKTIRKIVTVLLSAALCSMVSITFTFMMPAEVQLMGMAAAFVWFAHVLWKGNDHADRTG